MTKRQAENYANTRRRLELLNIEYRDVETLFRIERVLSRWSEEECNGTIQRDGENGDGAPRRYWEDGRGEHHKGNIVPDRERGALRRLAEFAVKYPKLYFYNQGDPRGCAVYVVDIPPDCAREHLPKWMAGNDTRGVAVCY